MCRRQCRFRCGCGCSSARRRLTGKSRSACFTLVATRCTVLQPAALRCNLCCMSAASQSRCGLARYAARDRRALGGAHGDASRLAHEVRRQVLVEGNFGGRESSLLACGTQHTPGHTPCNVQMGQTSMFAAAAVPHPDNMPSTIRPATIRPATASAHRHIGTLATFARAAAGQPQAFQRSPHG